MGVGIRIYFRDITNHEGFGWALLVPRTKPYCVVVVCLFTRPRNPNVTPSVVTAFPLTLRVAASFYVRVVISSKPDFVVDARDFRAKNHKVAFVNRSN